MEEEKEKHNNTPEPAAEENLQPGKDSEAPKKRRLPRWLRITLKTLVWIVIVVLLIPVLLYIPPVQDFVVKQAEKIVHDKTGMTIGIGKFRLSFPLDVHLQDVFVITAASPTDTMVRADEVVADVKLIPLLNLDVKLNKLLLRRGYYRMVSADSSMIMAINAGLLEVDSRSNCNIATSEINLNKVKLKDGSLSLFMDVWKKKNEPDTAKSTGPGFVINANDIDMENFAFGMSMLPTIDTLDVAVKDVKIRKAQVDLNKSLVTWQLAAMSDGHATYMQPTAEYVRTHPAPPSTPSTGPPMRIMGDSISLTGMKVLYTTRGVKPAPGFDASYLSLSGVAIGMRNFYNESSTVRLPLTRLEAKERCGLTITSGKGTVSVDSIGLGLDGLDIRTTFSHIAATADIPFALMALDPKAPLNARAEGRIGLPDVDSFMPSLKQFTSMVPARKPLNFNIAANGTLSDVEIERLDVNMPGVVALKAKGNARNPLDFKKLIAHVDFDGSLDDPRVADKFIAPSKIAIPAFTIKGSADAAGDEYGADFKLFSVAGDLAALGHVGLNSETYSADVDAVGIDVARFMPDLGIGSVTAKVKANGRGFNPMSGKAVTDAIIDIAHIQYNRRDFHNISANVTLNPDGSLNLLAESANPGLDFDMEGSGTIHPDDYAFDISTRIRELDLQMLGFSDSICSGSGDIHINGTASPGRWIYDVALESNSLDWNMPGTYIHLPQGVAAKLYADPVSTAFDLQSHLTNMCFRSPSGLKSVVEKFSSVATAAMRQVGKRDISIDSLSNAMPLFTLDLNASGHGLLSQFLQPSGMSVDTVYARISRDSLLQGNIGVRQFNTGSMMLDTITLNLKERGALLDYRAHLGNRPGTMDEFAQVNLNGYLGHNRIGAFLTQRNIKNQMGYRLGLTAALQDSVATVHFTPLKATIAYLPWQLNDDNFIDYNIYTNHIEANLMANSSESSILARTEPNDKGLGDDLHLKIDNLHIQDFLRMWALAPEMTGDVNADLRVHYFNQSFEGKGTLGVKQFTYERTQVGDFDLDLNADYTMSGKTAVNAALKVNQEPALAFHASLSPDSIGGMKPDSLGVSLTRFPLKIANPFLGKTLTLQGVLNGEIDMQGSFAKPKLNGYIQFDSVSAYVPVAAATLKFIQDRVDVVNNVVAFKDFSIFAANDNPLVINGNVDASDFSNIGFDLGMNANNMQLIKSDKRSKGDLFGKIFLNLGATVKGPMKRLDINGNVNLLGTTDATYRLNMSPAEFQTRQDDNVVKFVNFADSTLVAKADSVVESPLNMRINANVQIQPGTQVEVLLSTNGTDKLEISPTANLNYSQNYMGDMNLNGTLTLGNGYVRYSVPVIGEKLFTFNPASTITWSGNVMNPTLNVTATDEMKANVTSGNNSRLVNFLVTLHATNALNNLKVAFDLATNDDLSIQNELQSMSPDQRQTQAMNLLLYGQYTGQNTKANANLDGNFLYSFLESQLNSWAAKHIRGVDLSFGINQYDKMTNGVSNTQTSYSYQVSKSLFNNRFKIQVGGNYSTDANADENLADNLVSDVSMEYVLKQTQTTNMSVRLFRHVGYESILEGEITEMGAGFVMKRRIDNLKSLFRIRWGKRKPKVVQSDTAGNSQDSLPAKETPMPDTSKRTSLRNNDQSEEQ